METVKTILLFLVACFIAYFSIFLLGFCFCLGANAANLMLSA